MSYNLWKYFFDDDVDSFRLYLARATFDRNASRGNTGGNPISSFKTGSPGALGSSPKTPFKSRKSTGGNAILSEGRGNTIVLTRSDVNVRDAHGRTLLHHAVSSRGDDALEFVKLLLQIPVLDLYVQDTESGWTALHRALYFGNIGAAQALMLKDIQNATDYTTNISHVNAGGLVKIKDHEGNSPFELFGLTTAPRNLQQLLTSNALDAMETRSVQSLDMDVETGATGRLAQNSQPVTNLYGDDVFAFGSNKNITLGLGDGDDRTFPERIQLTRPDILLQRLLEDFLASRPDAAALEWSTNPTEPPELPSVVQNKPIVAQDVVMAKLHTAILTNDPISNLHICGFGPGGRLGTGDESTRFSFTCIQGGGLAKRKVSSVALGQDHTVAVCTSGEVFTWGSNKYGQLGYELPELSTQDVPLQLTPRQIYGLIKKEQIIGAAASSLHSAVYTSAGLYTFGKNDGQLGLMDADARSLEMQIIPRRVGVSVIQSPIQSVAAIDRATMVLLENHEVVVFTHYGWTKVIFPLDSFGSSIASDAFFIRHKRQTKHICRITAGGNTICALTSYGEVFTIDVPRHADSVPSSKSTTNPSKARNALPIPSKVWSIRKSHMAATDAAVGQDGSVILCTSAGTVWKKEKRANIKSVHVGNARTRPKDYKFVRVPNIFGAIAVRSNSFGAYTAVRKDCEVMREQIVVEPPTLHDNIFNLLAFKDYGSLSDDENSEEPQLRFWKPATKGPCPALIKRALILQTNASEDLAHITSRFEPLSASDCDVWVTSDTAAVRLPVHSFALKSRSKVLRAALATFHESYYFSIPDVLSLEYGADGHIKLELIGADFFTVVNLVLYLYTDTVANVWQHTAKALDLAPRYRSVRVELMKIASGLELKQLERAVRIMDEPFNSLRDDFELAFHDSDLFSDADVVVDLADGQERYAHSVILQSRCPFFEGLFHGHTGGMWLADRRNTGEEGPEAIRVDLKHISSEIFELVLRHIYADTDEELFDSITEKDLDSFIDIVIEVMAVANELMLERLARVCQKVVGRYVTPWNICGLLNTVAESSEIEFKHAGLEYIGLNLENMLEQRLLEELDEYLLEELDEMVQSNQMAFMPISRSGRALAVLLDQDPTLIERIETSRLRRLDAMQLPSRYVLEPYRPSAGQRSRSEQKESIVIETEQSLTPSASKVADPLQDKGVSRSESTAEDLQFEMDDEHASKNVSRSSVITSPELEPLDGNQTQPKLTRMSSSQQMMQDLDLDSGPSSLANTPRAGGLASSNSAQRVAWTKPNVDSPKLDLRDIMSQDASMKVSNLTQSLKQAASSAKQPLTKLSQKDRKRQQHEMKLHQAQTSVETDAKLSSAEKAKTELPGSPWQKIVPKPSPTPTQKPETPIASSPQATRSQSTSTQPTPAKSTKIPQPKAEKPAQPNRGVSSPGMTGVSKAPPPQIQSIRHTPTPARSSSWLDARTSMADILAQQQYEKVIIKETAAARSLQEIQQEQEFQQWWDSETKRLQEEEAATMAAIRRAKGGGSSGRGNRSSKRRGSDRGMTAKNGQEVGPKVAAAAVATPGSVVVESQSQPRVPLQQGEAHAESASTSRGRGGRSRGRGGGGGGAARGRGRGSSSQNPVA